ncbi:hypothetical protein ACFXK0_22030 [Nocardia sp. NPDC059177]|uniref:hypothetical protein n=1 Tax=Nocardia sp. NPDC059177 TaxID=3346759 RepID=UPI00368835A8
MSAFDSVDERREPRIDPPESRTVAADSNSYTHVSSAGHHRYGESSDSHVIPIVGDLHNIVAELNQLQSDLESDAAIYMWIDEVSRTLDRSGSDPSGSVHVTLDSQNLPFRISISQGWQARLPSSRLDAAVMEAAGVAYVDGWRRATEEVGWARQRGEVPPDFSAGVGLGHLDNRPLDDLVEEVLAATKTPITVDSSEESTPDRGSRIRFKFSDYGLSACQIDEDWARKSAGSRVVTDINSQLAAQREQYAVEKNSFASGGSLMSAVEQLVGRLQLGKF